MVERSRLKSTLFALGLMAGSALLATPALAQMGGPMPSPEVIAKADSFDPPKLGEFAKQLADQPDMTGLWTALQPAGAGIGPTFDPVNTFWPPQPKAGEAVFGPMPGTYLKDVPYNAEYKKKYEEYIKEAQEGKSRDTFAGCVPYGVPRMIGDSPVPFDIIQSPTVMFWYNDYGRTERRIFLDGRKHPTTASVTGASGPSYSGHSIGHWEGNTLVVETVGMMPGNFDETAAPFSDKLTMVERMRLIDTNVMEIQMTFTDPVAFEKPWVVTRYYRRGPGFTPGPPLPASEAAKPANQRIIRAFLDLNDRPCVPNVGFDKDGYQVLLLPQEVESQAAEEKAKAAKSSSKTKKKAR